MPKNRRKNLRFYFFRLLNTLQKSDSLPVRLRTLVIRAMGVKVGDVQCLSGIHFTFGEMTISDGAFINHGALFEASAPILIGKNVHIGPRAILVTVTHAVGREDRRAGPSQSFPIVVEDGAWIGAGAVILPGVIVSRGCVIGAGAVVPKSTEPNGLYVGVPARRVKELSPSS